MRENRKVPSAVGGNKKFCPRGHLLIFFIVVYYVLVSLAVKPINTHLLNG